MLAKYTILFLLFILSPHAHADFCSAIFKQLPAHVKTDAVEQMITWEQTSNTARWHKDEQLTPIEVATLPRLSVVVHAAEDTPKHLVKYFAGFFTARFPRHPYNEDRSVPYSRLKAKHFIPAKFSASRSMFIRDPSLEGFFSIKMPTNKPHKDAAAQSGKSDLRNSVIISRRRSVMIASLDKQFGLDPKFEVLTDKLSISDRFTGNGYVIRDLTPLTNGNYFLPAFSVPYAGREIAKHLDVPFESLWSEHWAASLGESKAKLLLRYGLEMKTPNAQNMLIELDPKLIPTGRMFFRDISDSSFVGPIAESLGLEKLVKADRARSYTVKDYLKPNWENSVWQMDEGGVSADLSHQWGKAHDKAYQDTILRELSRTSTWSFNKGLKFTSQYTLLDWLKSPAGSHALSKYHELLREENRKGMAVQ